MDITLKRNKRKTTEEFIQEAKLIHGQKYDYSKVEYVNANKNVKIICPLHGEFLQTPHSHLKGCGCTKCGRKKLVIKEGKQLTILLMMQNGFMEIVMIIRKQNM